MSYKSTSMRRVVLVLGSLLTLSSVTVAQDIILTGCVVENGQEVCLLNGSKTTFVEAPAATPTITAVTTPTGSFQTTAVTDCHPHGTTQYCVKGNGAEVVVLATATGNAPLPTAYTGCHAHGSEMFCMTPDGGEVQVLAEGSTSETAGHDEAGDAAAGEGKNCHFHAGVEHCEDEHTDEVGDAAAGGEENCHFHAGVEHCVGAGESENASSPAQCERRDRDYNRGLRIGLLFVILFTSGIACVAPLLMRKLLKLKMEGTIFTIVKQFGTGIILSTALVHLTTHATLMFESGCLGTLKYEGTTTAIIMAGVFISFLVDFMGHRLGTWRQGVVAAERAASINSNSTPPVESKQTPVPESQLAALSHHSDLSHGPLPTDALSVLVLEIGILFHSILIGITLVVAGDSVFITLFIVIVFHQMFEGLALGARIAAIDKITKVQAILMPLAYAVITPLGMAIGIAVLDTFNGNDPSTIIAIGTLDAVSAGILLWVGLVGMLARDWLFGEMRTAGILKIFLGMLALVTGMLAMSVLGKWA